MNSNGQAPDPTGPEMERFQEIRHCYPLEKLIPYEGFHVAWSLESVEIVATGNSMEDVENKVVAAGLAPNRVVYDYIDGPGASFTGGL
jgi:hypothetical protein